MKTQLLIYIFVLFGRIGSVQAQGEISLSGENKTGGTYTACSSIKLTNTFSFSAAATGKALHLKVSPSTCDPFGGADVDPSKIKDQNYIRTKTYLDENASRYLEQIQYFDDLGRPVQVVQRGVTPSAKDLITLQEYDAFGRKGNSWLPAVASGNNGVFVPTATFKTYSQNTYADSAYSRPVYEASPLKKVLEQYGPGKDWYINKKAVQTAYLTNDASTYSCIQYTVGGTNSAPTLVKGPNYPNAQLYVTQFNDEDGNTSYEFKDKLGQVVLTRQMNGTEKFDTYYVYDSFGNLCFVLPPLASTSGDLNLYGYQYKYDHRNRCTGKKLPGCGWISYVYDKADRLIFTQDSVQSKKTPVEWAFSIPDAFGRVVLTGTCTGMKMGSSNTQTAITKESLDNIAVCAVWAKTNNSYMGYTITGASTSTFSVLSANYYDRYEFIGLNSVPSDLAYAALSGYGTQYTGGYKGLLTGTMTSLLDGSTKPTYTYTAMHYDNRGRVIQTKSTNHLPGGIEKEYIVYNFTGQPVQKQHIHSATGKATLTEYYTYTYDHAGRLLTTNHQLNGGTVVTLAQNTYDELGRLKTNMKNNQSNLTTSYAYNIRSWTKSISSPLFKQTLYYNEAYGGNTKQYNGNISAIDWTLTGDKTRGYAFTYDNLSRLTAANYLENAVASTNYKTSYTYDKHGNMKTLQRYGKTTSGSTYDLIDNLTIAHKGNQLQSVSDAGVIVSMAESADFKNYSNAATEYQYNGNGAMIQDLNKGITDIQYNLLNLPQVVVINSPTAKAKNYYTYSASGVKLRTEQRFDPTLLQIPVANTTPLNDGLNDYKTTEYANNVVYEILKSGTAITNKTRILIDGGYIEGDVYYFYLTDHLGNNRIVAKADGTEIQRNHYYPFGMAFAEITTTEQNLQPYKYNGKELDNMHQVNLYDYSARYYDGTLPGFTTQDPHSENYYSWSPYVYCLNNPMRWIDKDGRDIWEINEIGKIVNQVENKTQDAFFMVNADGTRIDGQSISFEYGTVNQSTVTVNSEDGKSSWSYDLYNVNGGENATSLFHFVADNTNVEWSHGVFGKNGERSSNFITTAHSEKNEAGMIDQYMAKFMEGIPIIEHTHNHPKTIYAPFPSGLPDTGYDGGDIAFSKSITLGTGMISETAPTFNLYIPQEKKTYKYRPNSVKTDFQFFNKK